MAVVEGRENWLEQLVDEPPAGERLDQGERSEKNQGHEHVSEEQPMVLGVADQDAASQVAAEEFDNSDAGKGNLRCTMQHEKRQASPQTVETYENVAAGDPAGPSGYQSHPEGDEGQEQEEAIRRETLAGDFEGDRQEQGRDEEPDRRRSRGGRVCIGGSSLMSDA